MTTHSIGDHRQLRGTTADLAYSTGTVDDVTFPFVNLLAQLHRTGHPEQVTAQRPSALKHRLRWVLLGVCAVLLVSFGGAVIAAPVTIPLLLFSVRSGPTRSYRTLTGVVVVLTTAEFVWALTYTVQGEAKPVIWLAPVCATFASVVAYARFSRPAPITRRAP